MQANASKRGPAQTNACTPPLIAVSYPPPCGGGENRVDLAFLRFSLSLKGVWGPKKGQNLGKIGSIWHIFPFLGPFFVPCLLAFGDTVAKCWFLLVFGKPPKMPNRPHFAHITPPLFAITLTRRSKGRSSPAKGYKFGCFCSSVAGP